MSLLSEYEQRTVWKYEPIRGSFHTAESLSNKIDSDGNYLSFPGTTVVFRPEKMCVQIVQLMQKLLYRRLEDTGMLAFCLPASTIHMTLHDLVSPEMCVCDPADKKRYKNEMDESLEKAVNVVKGIRKDYAGRKITMAADRIVNMVSQSLVLMLKPQTEQDYELLIKMYKRFDDIINLPYPLTPHITLAYFKPGMLDGDRLGTAVDFAQINPDKAPVFDFYPEGLTAQRFLDMKSYLDFPQRICFCCDGGMNRSVMAAHIMNHMAGERNLPVQCEARSAFQDTQGTPVPEQVWETLERHGIEIKNRNLSARFLEVSEASHFGQFAFLTDGAQDQISWLGLSEERFYDASSIFYGVRDPQYGDVTYEQAFQELYARAVRYLDFFEEKYKGCIPKSL